MKNWTDRAWAGPVAADCLISLSLSSVQTCILSSYCLAVFIEYLQKESRTGCSMEVWGKSIRILQLISLHQKDEYSNRQRFNQLSGNISRRRELVSPHQKKKNFQIFNRYFWRWWWYCLQCSPPYRNGRLGSIDGWPKFNCDLRVRELPWRSLTWTRDMAGKRYCRAVVLLGPFGPLRMHK